MPVFGIARISQQVERASRIVGDLRAFVRGTAAEKAAPFDPAVAVRSAVDLTAHGVNEARSSLSSSVAEGLPPVSAAIASTASRLLPGMGLPSTHRA